MLEAYECDRGGKDGEGSGSIPICMTSIKNDPFCELKDHLGRNDWYLEWSLLAYISSEPTISVGVFVMNCYYVVGCNKVFFALPTTELPPPRHLPQRFPFWKSY